MEATRATALGKVESIELATTGRPVRQGLGDGVPETGDVDLWAVLADREQLRGAMAQLGAIPVARAESNRWLQHDVFVLSCNDGYLLLDIKYGDLKVGPLTLLTESDLVSGIGENGRFTGVARVTDVVIRRLARGKPVDAARLESATGAWSALDEAARNNARNGFDARLGARASAAITDLLEGRAPADSASRELRKQVRRSYFSHPDSFRVALVKAIGRLAGVLTMRPQPFGMVPSGVLVSISGTDGTGKSTTLENVTAALRAAGFKCRQYYLGRGRGNIPGVAWLRNLVSRKVQNRHDTDDVYRSPTANTLASWLYCFEYFVRTLAPRFFARVMGQVVICDRYCYDISLMPGGSPRAATFARALCPTPDINVLLHAPPDVLMARKAERVRDEIIAHQAALSAVIESGYARYESMALDTNELSVENVRDRICGAIVESAHRRYI